MNTLKQEKTAAMRIIDRALAKGYFVSVNDGEVWVVKGSKDRKRIMDALQSTDSDTVRFRKADTSVVGSVWFVWGNSPEEVAADYSDNAETRALVEGVA
jgi:hypothetical protein